MARVAGMCVSLARIVGGHIVTVLLAVGTIPDRRQQLADFWKPPVTRQESSGDSHENYHDDRKDPQATLGESGKPDLLPASGWLYAVSPSRDFIGLCARGGGAHWKPPDKGEILAVKRHAIAKGMASSAQRENAYVSLGTSRNQSKSA
jgi:hypothetical protein